MARIRSIKPEFFDDENLCELPFQHRLAYVGLWTQADKVGRMEDRPRRLKARIFPFDDVDMDAILTDLARGGFVIRYLAGGKPFLAIKPTSWDKHQRPRQDEPESVLPGPDTGTVVYASLPSDEPVTVESLGKERKGKEVEGTYSSEAVNGSEPVTQSQELIEAREREDGSPSLLVFPVIGVSGTEWALTQRQADNWRLLFPGLDIDAEARKALAWIQAHPDRRKTPKGMPKFLVAWLTRTVDRGRASTAPAFGKTAGNISAGHRFIERGQQ